MAAERVYGGTSLVDVLDRILDKGLVIDAWVRVSVVGLELITIEARVVIASVDTYLRYAQAIGLTPMASRPPLEQGQGRGGNGQGGGQGLLSGVTGALQGGQGSQGGQGQDGGGGPLGGLAGQLQGVLDSVQGGQGGQLPCRSHRATAKPCPAATGRTTRWGFRRRGRTARRWSGEPAARRRERRARRTGRERLKEQEKNVNGCGK